MPRVLGDGIIHVDKIDFAIEHDTPLYSPKPKVLSEVEKAIGRNVAGA